MKVICAWCKTVLGEVEGEGETHGMCPDCREKYFGKNVKARIQNKEFELSMEAQHNDGKLHTRD